MDPASVLLREVRESRPDVYGRILHAIRPHAIESVARILNGHLEDVRDLAVFERHRSRVPDFLLAFVLAIRKNVPEPGDAFGIKLTCRITKNDTQDTLDSRHLRGLGSGDPRHRYNVEADIRHEIDLYSVQPQILEIACRRRYSSLYLRGYSTDDALALFPGEVYRLEPGYPYNKGLDSLGRFRYLSAARYIVTRTRDPDVARILYASARDAAALLRFVRSGCVFASGDIRTVFRKCGIVCYFFNMVALVRLQLPAGDREMRDVLTVVKYQCSTGQPLPLNRVGLAKNPRRSPLEVLSFEAPKRNYVRYATADGGPHPVETSADKIFFGQQFNEGTGNAFAVLPRVPGDAV